MKTFKKEELRDLLDGETETLKVVSDTISGTSRWSIEHDLVFHEKPTGKFYSVGYSVGATEQQDERPFEYDDEDVRVTEVRPVQRTITVYEPAPAETP